MFIFLVWRNNQTYRRRDLKRRLANAPRPNGAAKRVECSPYFEKQYHNERTLWNIPCVRGVKVLFLSDSIFGSLDTDQLTSGVKVIAFGGLTLLELAFLINQGKLTLDDPFILPLIKLRPMYASQDLKIPFEKVCRVCNGCCYMNWKGHLLIHCGLNNLLKFKQKTFQDQNLEKLVEIVEESISNKFKQVKKVFWIMPAMPLAPKYSSDSQFRKNFDIFSRILSRRPFIKHLDNNFPRRNYSSDLLHLNESACKAYFHDIMELYN